MYYAVQIRYYDIQSMKQVDRQIALFESLKDASLFSIAYNKCGYTPVAYVTLLD